MKVNIKKLLGVGALLLVLIAVAAWSVFKNIRYDTAKTEVTDEGLRIVTSVGSASLGLGNSSYTIDDESVIAFDHEEYVTKNFGVGKDYKKLYFFRPVHEGKTSITVRYSNYHEDDVTTRTYDITVGSDMSISYE